MSWYYNSVILEDNMIPAKAEGIIYLITHIPTGKLYLGRKLLSKAHRRQKDKKIIKSRVESDWRTYWSSSPTIAELIEADGGTQNLKREILMFANTRGQGNYLEERFLYSLGAMESENWINQNIRAKMFKRNIINKIDTNQINKIIERVGKTKID